MNATEQEKDFITDLNAGEDILGIYADWLKETDQWSREHVYRKVLRYPEQDWARALYAMWVDELGHSFYSDLILLGVRGSFRYRKLDVKNVLLIARNEHVEFYDDLFGPYMEQIRTTGMEGVTDKGFISKIQNATFDSWHAHGPAIVAQHPITFVRLNVPENFYINYRDTGWLENSPHPEWYVVHWNGMSKSKTPTPFRKTREEAVAWTSKVLLSWARKQAGLDL